MEGARYGRVLMADRQEAPAPTLPTPGSLSQLLEGQAQTQREAPAISAPGRRPLGYQGLWEQARETAGMLAGMGVEPGDRVALVLPNGPEMATAFLAVGCCATCAPLNPAYRGDEFAFYLSDLGAKVLVVPAEANTPAVTAARELGIRVVGLRPLVEEEAGRFELTGAGGKGSPVLAGPEEVALVLHTSGTTSRPKIVPLSHANLCASAQQIKASLELTSADCCLNVMPLFHIHGLAAALLATLAAGGRVACTAGFYAPHFFDWLAAERPTWYTAVPSMHQAILARAEAQREVIGAHPLRFIRSCSSALPPPVMGELERVFGAPVLEAYGMTEAAHQICSNPLPPRVRQPGSVGVAAGPEVAIMDEAGHLLPAGERGEIVIRGRNVTAGYERNPEANRQAFCRGWFRSGDQGRLDEEGYLFITGRLKEIINRGGEKISPREIDEVLLGHPAVAQALSFALPHPQLGEEVGVAVVLREQAEASEEELQAFVAKRLADFKVPRQVVFLEELPKGATGKPQRIGLAERLGLTAPVGPQGKGPAAYVAPRTPVERTLAGIWGEVLRVKRVGINDSFFELGGDSVVAALCLARMREALLVELTLLDFFKAPTVAKQSLLAVQKMAASPEEGEDLDSLLAELERLPEAEAKRLAEAGS